MEEDKIACLLREIAAENKQFKGLIVQAAKLNAQSKDITAGFHLGIERSKEFVEALKWKNSRFLRVKL